MLQKANLTLPSSILILVLGFSLGSVFERRGWTPNFYDSNKITADGIVARSTPVNFNDDLSDLVSEGIEPGTGGPLITVFTNFECPYCATFDSVLSELVLSGRYRVNYRHVSYPTQRTAYRKHVTAESARLLGIGGESMVHQLYILPKNNSWDISDVVSVDIDQDTKDQLNNCVDGNGHLAQTAVSNISADSMLASSLGVTGTPSWVLAGRLGAGSIPIDVFDDVYEKLSLESTGE